MIVKSFLAGEKPLLNLSISAGASIITALALSIISSPFIWSLALVAGTIIAIVPVTAVLRSRRIERDQARSAELIPYKNKIESYDNIFDDKHAGSEKYQKLRQRLLDPGFPLNLTFEKIDELSKRVS